MTIPETNDSARSPSWVPKLQRSPERTAARRRSSPSPDEPPDGLPDATPPGRPPASGDVTQAPARGAARALPDDGEAGSALHARGALPGAALPDVEAERLVPVAAQLAQRRVAPDARVHLVTRLEDVGAAV